MDFWSSLDKASHISKIAYTALKNAQQKIDAVLDIQDVAAPSGSIGSIQSKPSVDNPLTLSYSRTSLTNAAGKRESFGASTETIVQTVIGDDIAPSITGSPRIVHAPEELTRPSDLVELTSKESQPSPLGSSTGVPKATSHGPSSKSCSDGDLSLIPSSPPEIVTPPKCTHASPEEDVETNTTGSDIEVISCCTSNNDDALHSHTQAADTMPSPGHISVAVNNQKHVNYLPPVDTPLITREFRTHMALSTGNLRTHRRAVSHDYRFGFGGPNEDDISFALQRLSKNYAEKKHLLSIREAKILELSKENNQLRDMNALLESQLKNGQAMIDLSALSSEFSQRLSKTELQLRMVTRERDQLKASLASNKSRPKQEKSNSVTAANENVLIKRISELEHALSEKTTQLDELLKEGEALAQKQLKTNNLVKKLRNDQKEAEKREQAHSEKIEQLSVRIQRLQNETKSKEETIKEQTGKVNHFCKITQTQEKELECLKVQLLHSESKIQDQEQLINDLKRELTATKDELQRAQNLVECEARAAENEQSLRDANQALKQRLEITKAELASVKANHNRQADQWREERTYYQNQLAESASRAESLGELATSTAQPLLLQLRELQTSFTKQTVQWEQTEQELNHKLVEAQQDILLARESERTCSAQLKVVETRNTQLERELSELRNEHVRISKELDHLKESLETTKNHEDSLMHQVNQLQTDLNIHMSRIAELENSALSDQRLLDAQIAENRRLTEQLRQTALHVTASSERSSELREASNSPTIRPVAEPPSPRSSFSLLSNSPSLSRSHDLPAQGNQTTLEFMQSLLQLKDGECTQLRRDIERLARSKETLLAEVASLSAQSERFARLAGLTVDNPRVPGSHSDDTDELQRRYDSLLLILGKVTEENNELRMDLADIKEMYKTQIDMLLSSPKGT